MAAYMKKAEQASKVVDSIMSCLGDHPDQDFILSQVLYLYNLGIRTAPRPTQSTVRLNAVVKAASNQPAKVTMVEKSATGYKGQYTFKAINIQVSPSVSVQDTTDDTE